jgi:hypothetical protein
LGTKYTIILTYNTAQGCVYTTTSKTTTVVHVVDDANDDFELREVNRNADEWLEAMFDSDSDNDMEFEGFQEDWTHNNFASRLPSHFKLIGGATVQHPEEAEAHH